MFPTPLTDTPASAPAVASPPPGGGAHHHASKGAAKASSFATLIDAGLVKATLIAAAAGTDPGTASVDVADDGLSAESEGTAAGAAPIGLPGKAVDARQRAHTGRHKGSIRVDAATVLPAWMQSTKATMTRRSDMPRLTASNDGDNADDGALGALAAVPTPVPVNPQPAVPLAVDLQMLATQIPVPGDENATADSTSEQPGDGASSGVTSGDSGLANGRVVLGARFGQAQIAPADNAGHSRGAQMPLAHASTNAVLIQSTTDAPLADPSTDAHAIDLQSPDDSLLDRLRSAATIDTTRTSTDTTGTSADASKRAHSVREIARSGSAAAHSTQPVPAPTAAAQNAVAPSSSTRSTPVGGAAVQTDAARKLSPSVEPARRSEAATIPSIRFGETANGDTDTAEDSEDSPSDPHQQPSASAATRMMAGVVSMAGDAQASTQAHAAAPVFTVPTTAPVAATPTVTSTEATAPANAPTIDAQNIDRLVQSMHVNAKSGVMEATVRLRPDYLGDVTIELRVDGTGVSAVVRAESAGVRQWLESHEETIRNGLAEHGLELTRFVVNPDGQQQSQPEAQRDPDEQRRAAFRRRQQAASTQRFEITV